MDNTPFEEIVLSRKELKMLRKTERGPVVIDNQNRAVIDRLRCHDFVTYILMPHPIPQNNALAGGVKISCRGKDYLAYLSEKKQDSGRSFRRDLLFALIGAVLAMLVDHADDIIIFAKLLLEGG